MQFKVIRIQLNLCPCRRIDELVSGHIHNRRYISLRIAHSELTLNHRDIAGANCSLVYVGRIGDMVHDVLNQRLFFRVVQSRNIVNSGNGLIKLIQLELISFEASVNFARSRKSMKDLFLSRKVFSCRLRASCLADSAWL